MMSRKNKKQANLQGMKDRKKEQEKTNGQK
jgi:hypothetical protein